nr:hypothetical protein [Tanacetum cinerariifolium]
MAGKGCALNHWVHDVLSSISEFTLVKTDSIEAPEIEKSSEDITKEKMKEMMQLVPVEDIYVQALQVKHPIIDWKDMAFISSSKNSSKEDGNTACVTTARTAFPTSSVNVVTISQDTATNEEDHALVADEEAPTKSALIANTESKVFDNSLCSNECKKNTDSLNSKIKDLKSELSEANNYIYHYKLAVAQLEGRLTEYKEREVKYIEKIRTLEMYRASNLKSIKALDKELEEVKLEKDGLD